MMKKTINQNTFLNLELYNAIDYQFIFSDSPIRRTINTASHNEEKKLKLDLFKKKISSIKDCDLKNNVGQTVFSSGLINSKIMIIGDSPSKEDEKSQKPFTGESGVLLKKMLLAIELNIDKIYLSNYLNFNLSNDKKLTPKELNLYSDLLNEHISIIQPNILILMGEMATEAVFKKKITISERGKWKKIIINQKEILCILTFHPSELLLNPGQKKMSWIDLKNIKNKINTLNLK